MLKWGSGPSTYRYASTVFGEYRVIGRNKRKLSVRMPDGYMSLFRPYYDIDEAKAACEADYARRVASLAAANGYVKLEPGQIVVDAAEVGDALDALCDTCAGECSMCRVKDVLSAIKEARDE